MQDGAVAGEGSSAPFARLAECAVEGFDHGAHLRSCERIVDVLAVTAALDEVVGAQAGELLRHGWLSQVEHLIDLGHGPFAFDQQTEDDEAGLV